MYMDKFWFYINWVHLLVYMVIKLTMHRKNNIKPQQSLTYQKYSVYMELKIKQSAANAHSHTKSLFNLPKN